MSPKPLKPFGAQPLFIPRDVTNIEATDVNRSNWKLRVPVVP